MSASNGQIHGEFATENTRADGTYMHLQGAHISGNPRLMNAGRDCVTNTVHNYGETNKGDLERLEIFVSFDAQFDSSAQDPDRRCHPGTRDNVLQRLRNWTDNPDSTERVCWLHGPAGAGKSAIAQTIAHSYDRSKVPATFFFFKSDANRNDGNRLFPTLAYQLAFSMPAVRESIANSLEKRPDLPRAAIETQFKQLLARPFYVLSEDATQQLAPAVDVIMDIVKQYRAMAPVIIIDGIDECIDENLQRQFLKVIGNAVMDNHFPLRFLIVSRPEVHIEQNIRRFQRPGTLTIDLAQLDDANKDVEKYLKDEFSRIASDKGLDQTWPGQKIIDDIVFKSSGNFIFASLVIRFVGDPYAYAPTQLDIVLNIKPPKTTSPFELLDQLYLEILKRVPDQDFLKKYLALFTARISVPNGYRLHKDDAMVMYVSEEELHANLGRMRSIFKFKDGIDVHHKSFIDFLYDSSRSGQYYISKPSGGRRFVELFIDSFIRCIYSAIEEHGCDHHHNLYLVSAFRDMIRLTPLEFKLPTDEWQEAILPLLDLQDKLLQFPDVASWCLHARRDSKNVFQLQRELLHIGLYHGIFDKDEKGNRAVIQSVMNVRKRGGVASSAKTKAEAKTPCNEVDDLLLLLLSQLPEVIEGWSPNKKIIKLVKDILCFNYAETATRVRFLSDAQKLMDLLDYLIAEKDLLVKIDTETTHKATLLSLEIFARVPVLPLASFSKGNDLYQVIYKGNLVQLDGCRAHIQLLFQTLFTNRILEYGYVSPVLVDREMSMPNILDDNVPKLNIGRSMKKWRSMFNLNSTKIQIVSSIAKDIQYFHSMGIVLESKFSTDDLYLDGKFRPKLCCLRSLCNFQFARSPSLFKSTSLERNIFCFGYIVYGLFSGILTQPENIILERPLKPEIPEYVWQLIQRCCGQDEKRRPTIDEVVKEIESWVIETGSLETGKPTQKSRLWKIKTLAGMVSIFGRTS